MQHRNSRIYRRALELLGICRTVIDGLPPGFGFLADQLRRAGSSVVQNFSEGCGKRSHRDRRRFFDIAKGSAYEIAAILDIAEQFEAAPQQACESGRDICDHLGAMLSRYK